METAAIALIVVLLVAMACGLEITWALGLSCVVAVLLDPKLSFVVIAQRIFANSNSFSMLAIPAFMLAGDVMSKGGLSKRLVAFADSLVGWISGGISLVSIVACTFFAAISGSSVATTAAIGGLMYPEMVKRGYPESYAAAVQCAVSDFVSMHITRQKNATSQNPKSSPSRDSWYPLKMRYGH